MSTEVHGLEITPPLEGEKIIRAGFDIAMTTDDDEHSENLGVSPLFQVAVHLTDVWDVSAAWGFAWVRSSPDEGAAMRRLAPSNLMLGAGFQSGTPEHGFMSVRLALAAPLATLPDHGTERGLTRSAYAYALAARGLYDPWVWAPEQAGAALQGAALFARGTQKGIMARFATEGGIGLTVPMPDSDASTQFFGEGAGEALLGSRSFGVGPRLQAVWMPANNTGKFQSSAGGSVLAWLGEHVLMKAQLLINLDRPLGHGLGSWGFKLGGSGAW